VHMEEILKGASFGIYYLTIYAAFSWYDLIGKNTAAIFTVIVTIAAFSTSVVLNKEIIALFAGLGGYLSPFLLSTGRGSFIGLMSFVSIVAVSSALLSLYKVWRNLGMLTISVGWSLAYAGFVGIFEPSDYGIWQKGIIALSFILMYVSTGPLHFLRYEPT